MSEHTVENDGHRSGEIAALAEVLRGIGFIGTHADFGSLTGDDDAKRRWAAEQIIRAWT